MKLDRREFICGASLAAAGCVVANRFPVCEGYSVSVLGDIHYDRPPVDTFHARFRELHLKDGLWDRYEEEFSSFSSMWGDFGCSGNLVEASGCAHGPDSRLVVQLGDLIEGDCESPECHRQMLSEALELMKRTYGDSIPFVTVCGNHDIRQGANRQGEYDNYRRIASAWHSRELSQKVDDITFSFWQGSDLWIVADYNRPDVERVEMLLDEGRSARYVFFCTHGAVLTDGERNPRCWFYLGRPQYDSAGRRMKRDVLDREIPKWNEARRRIRRILAERQAIVLSGHSHRLELRDWFGDGGRITEFVMNSTTRTTHRLDLPGLPRVVGDAPGDFGRCRYQPRWGASEDAEGVYREYAAGIRRYYTADAAGHAVLRVSDEGVRADYYPLDATTPCQTFVLRERKC